ncbi:MAG: type II secretion system protein, partial [Culicoidibacterales bacterium]
MFKTIKNQKGITLVELLAVMVIVGIIAAISIPAIGNLIENTRKDAYIATAKNMQEAARIVASQNAEACATTCTVGFDNTTSAVATNINGKEYIENMEADYLAGTAKVVVTNTNGQVTYATTLTGVATSDKTYKLGSTTSTSVVALDAMTWTR